MRAAVTVTAELRGEMCVGEPLARYTSWRVGGPAQRLYKPADSADLVDFLKALEPGEPLLWIGLGSNLLVRDGGFRGTVILTQGCLTGLRREGELGVRAEAGVSCAKVSRFAARHGLTGAEFLAGIPGTLGGALAMNAGAFGGETWERVASVETVDRFGVVRRRDPSDYRIAYRQVDGPQGEWFLSALLTLAAGDSAASQSRIRSLLERRGETQPIGLPSCGSVFRNPPGDYAARLIESAGLKGVSIGGAQVSEKHANFIINRGGATARDIEQLIDRVQQEVDRVFGVRLIPEVHRVGEAD